MTKRELLKLGNIEPTPYVMTKFAHELEWGAELHNRCLQKRCPKSCAQQVPVPRPHHLDPQGILLRFKHCPRFRPVVKADGDTIRETIQSLEAHFEYRLQNARRKDYERLLARFSRDTVIDAGMVAMRQYRAFPTLDELQAAAYRARSEKAQRERAETPTFNEVISNAKTEHAKEAFRLIRDILRHKFGPSERAAQFREMHAKHPGQGWDEAALQAESTWGDAEEKK